MTFILEKLLCVCLTILLVNYNSSGYFQNENQESGKNLYEQNCTFCHGSEGNISFGGSKKIAESTMTLKERITLISKGRGKMSGYENKLDRDQIALIAAYTIILSETNE